MYIFEIFSNEYPGPWHENGRFRFRGFEVNDKPYVVQLEHKVLPGKLRGTEVSFFRSDITHADLSFSTTRDQQTPVPVYGHVFGMIRPLYRETGETLFFSIEARHSLGVKKDLIRKSRIYKRSAEEMVKKEGGMCYVARSDRDHQFLVTKKALPADHPYWVNERNEALIAAGLKPVE